MTTGRHRNLFSEIMTWLIVWIIAMIVAVAALYVFADINVIDWVLDYFDPTRN